MKITSTSTSISERLNSTVSDKNTIKAGPISALPDSLEIRFAAQSPQMQETTPQRFVAEVIAQLGDKGALLVATDVDGTLTPLVSDVRESILTPVQQKNFFKLADALYAKFGTELSIVTGRKFDDAVATLGGLGAINGKPIMVVTDQGLRAYNCMTSQEVEIPEAAPYLQQAKNYQQTIKGWLKDACQPKYGFGVIEYKAGGIAVNTNQARKDRVQRILSQMKRIAKMKGMIPEDPALLNKDGDFVIVEEKGVIEIKPRLFNKGNALEGLKKRQLPNGGTSIFMGDSETDNDGFNVSDLSLYLGKASPAITATHTVSNPESTEGDEAKNPDGTINQTERTRISQKNADAGNAVVQAFLRALS